jgi:hypothetical protein
MELQVIPKVLNHALVYNFKVFPIVIQHEQLTKHDENNFKLWYESIV